MGRLLVAGIGNVFLGDDAFGVEVVRRLASESLPGDVTVMDVGIRGLHLAYELLDGEYDEVIFVDAMPQQAAPGTIAVIEPDVKSGEPINASADGHAMDPVSVLRLLEQIGGQMPLVRVVGCEPASLDEGIGLSPPVASAVDAAVRLILDLARKRGRDSFFDQSGETASKRCRDSFFDPGTPIVGRSCTDESARNK